MLGNKLFLRNKNAINSLIITKHKIKNINKNSLFINFV